MTTRTAGLRGKLEAQHLAMGHLSDYTKAPLPVPPAKFDYAKKVHSFPMAGNDRYGDCTMAGVIHMIQIAYAAVGKTFKYPGDQAVEAQYFAMSHDVDSGLVITDVLAHWHNVGLFGTKIAGYAPVDHTNWDEMAAAAYAFGGLYIGVEMPSNAEKQFESNQPWHIAPDSGQPVGGHCVTFSGFDSTTSNKSSKVETWGAETSCTKEWWDRYGSQAFAVIFDVFVQEGHGPIANIHIDALQADLKAL